jgi:hypothetical protein
MTTIFNFLEAQNIKTKRLVFSFGNMLPFVSIHHLLCSIIGIIHIHTKEKQKLHNIGP